MKSTWAPLGGSRDCLSSPRGVITIHSTNQGTYQPKTYMNRFSLMYTHGCREWNIYLCMTLLWSLGVAIIRRGRMLPLPSPWAASVCLCACDDVRPASLASTSKMAQDELAFKMAKRHSRALSHTCRSPVSPWTWWCAAADDLCSICALFITRVCISHKECRCEWPLHISEEYTHAFDNVC